MKKRFTYLFIANIILTIIAMVLFFITERGWTLAPIALILILYLYGYNPFRKNKIYLWPSKGNKFNLEYLFNDICVLAIIYNPLAESKLLIIQIIPLVILITILGISIYGLNYLYQNKT